MIANRYSVNELDDPDCPSPACSHQLLDRELELPPLGAEEESVSPEEPELGPDDDETAELDNVEDDPLSPELLEVELPLEAEGDEEPDGTDELGADDDDALGVEPLDDGAELDGEELPLDDGIELDGALLLEGCDELDELPLSELLEQQSQQQQPASWLSCQPLAALLSAPPVSEIVTVRR